MTLSPILIPDHEVFRPIGSGNYGQVWLAKSVLGIFRAVKVIRRSDLPMRRPYDREFMGIMKFEPISRGHAGFVNILHVGLGDKDESFYYIMELGDDQRTGQQIDPDTYVPKTLSSELEKHSVLPFDECLRVGMVMSAALDHLHRQGLIHRDVKPANVVFIKNIPKLADIGLVAQAGPEATFVGTEGYVPPEGPGKPSADVFSFGKVLYQIAFGQPLDLYPRLPDDFESWEDAGLRKKLYGIIRQACELDSYRRIQTARQIHDHLMELHPDTLSKTSMTKGTWPDAKEEKKPLNILLLYSPESATDTALAEFLSKSFKDHVHQVMVDAPTSISIQWAKNVEQSIIKADVLIVLMSKQSIDSEMIKYELDIALEHSRNNVGMPRLIGVGMELKEPIGDSLAPIKSSLDFLTWEGPHTNERLFRDLIKLVDNPEQVLSTKPKPQLETVGGAVPLESAFYIRRDVDSEFDDAIDKKLCIVLIKGSRQMGKTSLLARGLRRARENGYKVIFTDFDRFNSTAFESLNQFYFALGSSIADQLDLRVYLEDVWNSRRSPNTNFERYMQREVLKEGAAHLVWGLDGVDRLFEADFPNEIFGMFRSWYNARALEPDGAWNRITLAFTYGVEAHMLISDPNQSPFNVGESLALPEFTQQQVSELNHRHGDPLPNPDAVEKLMDQTGGHPFLIRRALNEMISRNLSLEDLIGRLDQDDGIFRDHLRRMFVALIRDKSATEYVRYLLNGESVMPAPVFYRLRTAGILSGDNAESAHFRCRVYEAYLKRNLLSSGSSFKQGHTGLNQQFGSDT